MSQTGANYLANQGWTWAEILAHYYYDPNTKIIEGDIYPDKITYAGAEYETREFLARALESEMGSSFHTEALKAQCVAIYTFAKHNKYNLNADATAFDKSNPSSTVYSIVDEVMREGFYIANNDGVALTPYHAMSAGKTTSYYNVWGKNSGTHVSYLEGGRKSYGDYLHTDYKSVYTITSDDLKKLIESNEDLKVKLSGDPSTWLTILTHDQAVREDIGYVSTINVGGMVLTGNDFRIKVMEGRIRSHCFALQYTPM
jgi:SpoIID/LytB domain protein